MRHLLLVPPILLLTGPTLPAQHELFDTFDFSFTTAPPVDPGEAGRREVHGSPNGSWWKVHWPSWSWCAYRADHVRTSRELGYPDRSELCLIVPGGGLAEGAHLVSQADYGYGSYRIRMRTAATGFGAAHGTVAGFFYYLDQHGEIDVEILSKEQGSGAGRVHLSVHDLRNGIVTETRSLPLAFSPAEAHHEYGFDWYADRVEFFVDGVLYSVIRDSDIAIPSLPGPLMINHWTGSAVWGGTPPPGRAELRVAWANHAYWPHPILDVEPWTGGSSPELRASDCEPGAEIYFGWSLTGPGPTPTPYGDVKLSPPIERIGPFVADSGGRVSTVSPTVVPPGLIGSMIWLQALEIQAGGASRLSNPIADLVE